MNTDVEFHIRHNYPWSKLPANVRQSIGNSQKEYDKAVLNFSVKNQLRYKGNLVRSVKKYEKQYYEELLRYSREHLMLYPYHLSDVMVKGLRITPFAYYISIMSDIMTNEKSYDSLPNFTAADCLRLLGIGRNQYIDLMNQNRSSKKFFRKKPVRELLPAQPIENIIISPWWVVHSGYITEDDVKMCNKGEKDVIDKIIDSGPQTCGELDNKVVHSLFRRGLVYLDVSIADDDCIIVPPLEGFVMNRVLGDYFETLLYKIFVSIDEHTPISELANVLQVDMQLVKNAVSMYCRLGFAKKKGLDINLNDLHPSWQNVQHTPTFKKPTPEQLLIDWNSTLKELKSPEVEQKPVTPDNNTVETASEPTSLLYTGYNKRIAFLFDSTLTAFLMMGNLSPGLKSHAVTMFEVGKLSDESLDSFLSELEKVRVECMAEGEAQRYFDHAITLRDTIRFLRNNPAVTLDDSGAGAGQGIDLLRCESLLGLDYATCSRVLNRNYSLLVSMAPLSNEIRPITSSTPQHLGPSIPEVNSPWFKLYIYQLSGSGPPTLLLVKGTRLRKLPRIFQEYDKLLVTTWGHDPGVIPTSNILLTLNDALQHSAVLIQGNGWHQTEGETYHLPFPLEDSKDEEPDSFVNHPSIKQLNSKLDLKHTCGYISLLKTGKQGIQNKPMSRSSSFDPNQLGQLKAVKHGRQYTPGGEIASPSNGIRDKASAQMLASELDSLNEELDHPEKNNENSISISRDKLRLDFDEGVLPAAGKTISPPSTSSTAEHDLFSDWVMLDCCFGIPLFNADVNEKVCERIASRRLCTKNSLNELLHSSRTLSLRLLNFIAEHQDLPVVQEQTHESGMLPSSTHPQEQTVPLPTHSLVYNNGVLSTWDGL